MRALVADADTGMSEAATAADGRRAAAVFTIVREEAVFLPIWLAYYAAHFAPEDIYVLHHVVPGGPEDRCAAHAHRGWCSPDPDPGPLHHSWLRPWPCS